MVLFDMLMEIIKYIPGPDSDHKPLILHSVGLHALENYCQTLTRPNRKRW